MMWNIVREEYGISTWGGLDVKHLKPTPRLLRGIMVGFIVIIMLVGSGISEAEERLLPFNQELAATVLEKTLAQKVVGREFDSDGMRITITRLNRFVMDWETSRFTLDCEFRVGYRKGFIILEEAGEVSLEGSGAIAAEEQKLGVKLNRVNRLRLNRMNETMNNMVTKVLDKMLSGKVFWPEAAPAGFDLLTKDNLDTLIQVALNRRMPQTVSGAHIQVTLNQVQKLDFTDEPGGMAAVADFEGKYDHFPKFSFSGQAGAALQVMLDPKALSGMIRIQQVTDLKVDRTAAFLDGILQRMINAKLQGKEVRFSWK